jgi:hypothetical protein
VAALREAAPELEISLPTGVWITDGDVERRLECVRGWTELPDCVSLNIRAARRAPRRLERGARRGGRGALPQAIRLTASSAATL